MCSSSKFYRQAEKLQAALCWAPGGHADENHSHALALIHLFVRIAAESETEEQGAQAIDDVLAGRNATANEAAAGLAKEMLADVPPEHRATLYAIGRDLAAVASKSLRDPRNRPAER